MGTHAPIRLFNATVSQEIEQAALDVMRSGQIASGPKVAEFEHAFGTHIGRPHLVSTSDMTSALVIALRLAGVGEGDEVMTLAFSCMSSNSAIAIAGAKAVWIDIDPATATMSVEDLKRALGPRSKAVILYHVAGYPGPASEILAVCKEHGLTLIEDCNNALGATQHGLPVGALGDYSVFSFYPNRQINAFEGGALACPDASTHTRALNLRRFGIDPATFRDTTGEINPQSDIPEIGFSASFNQLNAAVGMKQMDGLNARVTKTFSNAYLLSQALRDIQGIEIVLATQGSQPAHWAFLALAENRDRLLARLKEKDVLASKLHHRNDSYSGFHSNSRSLPGTDHFTDRIIGLPCGWWLDEHDISKVAEAVLRSVK